jgi:hypothetical protein
MIHLIVRIGFVFSSKSEHARYGRGADVGFDRAYGPRGLGITPVCTFRGGV